MKVGIFFFRPYLGGGTSTFTAHLFKAFEAAGHEPVILRVKPRGEPPERLRNFAQYEGVKYRNITFSEARTIVKDMPTVMGSPANSKYLTPPDMIMRLMADGMRTVIHDPNEFTIYDHLGKVTKLATRPICIRPTIRHFYKDAVWIPHPYMRAGPFPEIRRRNEAISIARIASVKRPRIVLEANRMLEPQYRVKLLGAEFRMYTKQLEAKYGDVFQQSGKTFQYPMTFDAPVRLAAAATVNVDMTWFPDDGGGTQYAQMEAMDAGCVNIMHYDWFRYNGELRKWRHVIPVNGPSELAFNVSAILNGLPLRRSSIGEIVHHGYRLLREHDPKLVGQMYIEEMLK